MMEHPWEGAMAPFRILGNTWFVGTRPASTHIIDTGDGLIMLDSGYQESLYLVIDSMHRCGFDPKDLRYIIHSHGHIDHAAATRALAEMTGAETFIGEGDLRMVDGSRPELTWAPEYKMAFPAPFRPDHLIHDGDQIKLGNVVIDCVATPGHTPGVISFFWNVEDDGKVYRAGTFGGAGMNSMQSAYVHKYHLEAEDWRGAFRRSIRRAKQEKVDLFIGNHAGQNQTPQRYQRILAGERLAFVEPGAWGKFLDGCEEALNKLEAEDPL
ncbi:MAG: MBL fold metallo-hydrolase [Lentisphaeria bacterium]|nr:MBL fold metallo-hydrolase [Lentisphaeria bacterium]